MSLETLEWIRSVCHYTLLAMGAIFAIGGIRGFLNARKYEDPKGLFLFMTLSLVGCVLIFLAFISPNIDLTAFVSSQ